jgi:gamma-glutamylcyclotransferase (GGCT)/AIG2-like uncharacterized protein YtfP
MMIKVFVYGTLKPGEINFQRYCQGKIIESQAAIAQGQLYRLPFGYPAMTFGKGWVGGFILSFRDLDLLNCLDELEGYDSHRPAEQNEYQRCQIEAFSPEKQPMGLAWGYIMTLEQILAYGGVLLPDGLWQYRVDSV